MNWTAQEISRYDQTLAETSDILTWLTAELHYQNSKFGPAQGLANIALFLSLLKLGEGALTGLLLAALNQLANNEPGNDHELT